MFIWLFCNLVSFACITVYLCSNFLQTWMCFLCFLKRCCESTFKKRNFYVLNITMYFLNRLQQRINMPTIFYFCITREKKIKKYLPVMIPMNVLINSKSELKRTHHVWWQKIKCRPGRTWKFMKSNWNFE